MYRWQGCLVLLFTVPGLAQEWRPVSSIKPEARTGITLGKPRTASSENSPTYTAQPLPREAVKYQSVRYSDLDRLPEPMLNYNGMGAGSPTMQTRYQGPSAAEEAFNCGQVPGQAPVGGAVPPPAGAPAPYYGQPGGPPPYGQPAPPPSGGSPWYQPVKDCWNKIFGGGSSNNGIPGTWDARSDQSFKDFISPVTNPTYFEDPRSLTEMRFIGIFQKSPSDNPLMMGGSIFDFIFQGRISINDQWSLTLNRLGVSNVNPGTGALGGFSGGTGLDNLLMGAKYTFLRDTRSESILAVGATFDIPIGSSTTLQGGSAAVTPYLSYGQGFGDNWHLLAAGGYHFSFNKSSTDFLYVSGHIDYGFFKRFYPLAEVNWYYYTSNGNRQPANYEGGDILNIGANDVSGKSLVTVAAGFRFKFSESLQTGIVYEMPVVGSSMLERYRVMLDLIFRY